MVEPFVPRRFAEEVGLHLLRNLRPAVDPGTPLILGIHGPSGDGKTFQTERVLEIAKVRSILVSGGELESGTAGEPAAIIRSAYREAGTYVARKVPAVLLLNDADAAIGSWGEMTQYTVNTQNVITELMHLADYPTMVEDRPTPRVPIIMTGNDFTRMYGPLCRHGRMELFQWTPSREERLEIISRLFPSVDQQSLARLIREFADRPLAFWRSVRQRRERAALLALLERQPIDAFVAHLLAGGDIRRVTAEDLDVSELRTLARELMAHDPVDHLSRPRLVK